MTWHQKNDEKEQKVKWGLVSIMAPSHPNCDMTNGQQHQCEESFYQQDASPSAWASPSSRSCSLPSLSSKQVLGLIFYSSYQHSVQSIHPGQSHYKMRTLSSSPLIEGTLSLLLKTMTDCPIHRTMREICSLWRQAKRRTHLLWQLLHYLVYTLFSMPSSLHVNFSLWGPPRWRDWV